MKNIMTGLQTAADWLGQRPQRNYTLGELFQVAVRGKDPSAIDDNILNFTRLGRGVERAVTGVGAASALVIVGSAAVGLSAVPLAASFAAAAAFMTVCKVNGLIVGKLYDRLAHVLNR